MKCAWKKYDIGEQSSTGYWTDMFGKWRIKLIYHKLRKILGGSEDKEGSKRKRKKRFG